MTTAKTSAIYLRKLFRYKSIPFILENRKLIAQFILTALFFGLGIWFVGHEHTELVEVRTTLLTSQGTWVLVGLAVTVLYIFLQGLMYVTAFQSIQCRISLLDSIILFLKRNFVSIFLPAGGISALVFFTGPLERKGVSKTQIHYASTLYAFIGILSVVLVAVPVFAYAVVKGNSGRNEWLALAALFLLTGFLFAFYRLLLKKGRFNRWVVTLFPSVELLLENIRTHQVLAGKFLLTVLISTLLEFTGIAHLYIAMKALQVEPSLFAAMMGYIVSVVFLVISPFLRGLGAVEVSMSLVLVRFGFTDIQSISITLLYRSFEFWLPLLAGLVSFISSINKLLMRTFPAILLLFLGIINIVSVITPAISSRIEHLQEYVIIDAMDASNYFVLAAGFLLLATAAFMLKGLRMAWWIALFLSIVSLVGHITKAIDYEEAIVALFIIVILLLTRKEYYVRNNPRLRLVGMQTALISIAAILLYGTVGFYLLDKKHFDVDFSLAQSVSSTIANYFLIGSSALIPQDAFGKSFVHSINIGGFLTMAFLFYTLLRPYVYKGSTSEDERARALSLLRRYGRTSLDYFKTYSDKMIFFPTGVDSFISYRIAGNYGMVLEDPVAGKEDIKTSIMQFDTYCYENSMKSMYYRVPEESLPLYLALGKKKMFIGQEAVVDLDTFSLEGGNRKAIRNAINKVKDRRFKATVHQPPVRDGLLQKLKEVSDEWLSHTDREEIVFSQGMFVWEELKNQTVITVENSEEKVVAFLNIVPDYAPSEGTFDLMRKTGDAPNGILDFLMVELFSYFRTQGIRYVNLGFVPMSGIKNARTLTEKSMKFAYEKIRSFSQYKGLREFKEKYDPIWRDKYLVYSHDYDLIQVPLVLSRVIKPWEG